MTSVFAVVCSVSPGLHETEFFATKEGARKHLAGIASDRSRKLGVVVLKNEPDKFSFEFGWEERQVSFSIIELPVKE